MSKFEKYLSEAKKKTYEFYSVWYDKNGKRLGEDEERVETDNPQKECERRVNNETKEGRPEENVYVTVQCLEADASASNRPDEETAMQKAKRVLADRKKNNTLD